MNVLLRIGCALFLLTAGLTAGIAAWANDQARTAPNAVLALWPDHARALGALIEQQRRQATGPKSDELNRLGVRLLARAPLSDAPLVVAGLAAVGKGDVPSADQSFAAVLARSPRNAAAHIWLAQRAIEHQDYPHALHLLDGLISLDRDNEGAYVDAIAALARDPKAADALQKMLDGASWGDAVVSRLNKDDPDVATLVRLNQKTPHTQAALLQRLLTERSVDEAFLAWLDFLPAADLKHLSWPYNADFQRLAAPPPFNWRAASDQVEFVAGGGLYTTYLGQGRPVLMDEVMLLRPGQYKFTAMMEGESKDSGGGLAWAIQCVGGADDLGAVRARGLSANPTPQTFAFSVPDANCAAQRLMLRGEPGEFPLRARATTHAVAIAREDDAR